MDAAMRILEYYDTVKFTRRYKCGYKLGCVNIAITGGEAL